MRTFEDLFLILLIAQERRLRDRTNANPCTMVASSACSLQSFCINDTSGCKVLLENAGLHKSKCYRKTSKKGIRIKESGGDRGDDYKEP